MRTEIRCGKSPVPESYGLMNRWGGMGKKDFPDLGCGLGRHSILFGKNGFHVSCFDISKYGIESTQRWAASEGLKPDCRTGDMPELPYENDSFDCILCRNVINHSDTVGVKKAISEIRRVLRQYRTNSFVRYCLNGSFTEDTSLPRCRAYEHPGPGRTDTDGSTYRTS